MNTYEKMISCEDGIDIVEYNFKSDNIKGLYCDGVIGINSSIDTIKEKACILAEELGHHYTSSGVILDQTDILNRKQEARARMWAYNKQIGLTGIINAYRNYCRNIYEIAEFLDVTEQFLLDSLKAYRFKYGTCVRIDNYVIYFEPHLYVADMNF